MRARYRVRIHMLSYRTARLQRLWEDRFFEIDSWAPKKFKIPSPFKNTGLEQNRETMSTFWRTFHHEGKISENGEGGGAPPFIYHHVQSCGVRSSWEVRYTPPLTWLYAVWYWYLLRNLLYYVVDYLLQTVHYFLNSQVCNYTSKCDLVSNLRTFVYLQSHSLVFHQVWHICRKYFLKECWDGCLE